MIDKISYKIFPSNSSEFKNLKGEMTPIMVIIALLNGLNVLIGFFLIFNGRWLISLVIFIILVIALNQMQKTIDEQARQKKAKEQAEILSNMLNEILSKSKEIITKMLPHFEICAQKSIDKAKIDFVENALYPFWERIEEATQYLGYFKEAVDQLVLNGELYSRILESKKHNFPIQFPIGTSVTISQNILDEYNLTVREAHKKADFANIFGHIKTQKVLIAGFQTLSEAINNMSNAIASAIYELKHSIESNFGELKNIQMEQTKSFEKSQAIMNDTLSSMDRKLYYIKYHKERAR